jgi:NADH dehydrogenase
MRAGPIAITGASGHVGTAVQARLAHEPNEVRPLGRDADLATAFGDAEVVVHLAGTLAPAHGDTYESANLGTARAVAAAVAGSAVERIVELSHVVADPGSSNAYLRAKGRAEAVLRETGVPVLTLRCPWIFGPPSDPGPSFAPFLARRGRAGSGFGRRHQRMAGVGGGGVAEAIARGALDPAAPSGPYALAGPDELTLDEMIVLLDGAGVRERHVPPSVARLLAHLSPRLDPTLVEVLLADSVGHDPSAAAALGLTLRPPREIFMAG